ncbi:hypothetical protein [Desulfovibrio sp. SGI.169]|uniref:hypothetical protein n=1 Tax=Desulfovibrio sp. SGI.169 TaxID=3420561 RepID=UPI003CFC5E83
MTERPILFSDGMVRAILCGQKTQTRRPVKPQPVWHPNARPPRWVWTGYGREVAWADYFGPLFMRQYCPIGQPGDRLWVKETFYKYYPSEGWPRPKALYRADGISLEPVDSEGMRQRWTPSIHMPRALSRITLEINDINVERVQDISEKDAWAEGMEALDGSFNESALCATAKHYDLCVEDTRCIYAHLWDSLYAKLGLGWDANPWVWAVEFERVEE